MAAYESRPPAREGGSQTIDRARRDVLHIVARPDIRDAFPPLIAYTLARPCPTCKAAPGVDCDAPAKAAREDGIARLRTAAGLDYPRKRLRVQHARRVDVGNRHYRRDVARAPWPEEREPGKRYDTLPDWAREVTA